MHRWIREERQRALSGQLQHSAPAFVAIEQQPPSVSEADSRALSPLLPQVSPPDEYSALGEFQPVLTAGKRRGWHPH